MVFCGKPSKACAPCRSRRTRCDAKRPSCGQCVRAGRSCAGYREDVDLMFRHETSKVRLLNGNRDGVGTVFALSPGGQPSALYDDTQSISPSANSILRPLSPDAEDQATCFFFKNYVLDEESLTRSYFDYLPALYGQARGNGILVDAVNAIGLAGLANSRRASEVMVKANLTYGRAVRKTSERLKTSQAKEDQTLVAVMLLGMYETNASDTPSSLRSWTSHITGSMAMLRLRGIEQLNTDIGRRIFAQIRSQIITTCFQKNSPIPQELWEWSQILKPHQDAVDVHDFMEISHKFCNLRSSMNGLFDDSNPLGVFLEGLEIDEMLQTWLTNAPPCFSYAIVPAEPSDDVYDDHYHVYQSVGTASMVNHYRCIRIILHEILISQIIHLLQCEDSPEQQLYYTSELQNSQALIRELKDEVCASVPFYFNYHKERTDLPNAPKPAVRAINGSFLLWSLYTIGVSGKISVRMRKWIVGRIEAIGERMGIRHAVGIAHVLGMGKEISVWDDTKIEVPMDDEGWDGSTKVVSTSDK